MSDVPRTASKATALDVLKSIDASLRELLALSKSKRARETPVDLDGQYGNPIVVAKDPRDWTGPTMAGKRLSECPATYLDLLAERYDYFASKETDEKKKRYAVLDGARCRGWAARARAGHKRAEPASAEGFPSDMMKADDISF